MLELVSIGSSEIPRRSRQFGVAIPSFQHRRRSGSSIGEIPSVRPSCSSFSSYCICILAEVWSTLSWTFSVNGFIPPHPAWYSATACGKNSFFKHHFWHCLFGIAKVIGYLKFHVYDNSFLMYPRNNFPKSETSVIFIPWSFMQQPSRAPSPATLLSLLKKSTIANSAFICKS